MNPEDEQQFTTLSSMFWMLAWDKAAMAIAATGVAPWLVLGQHKQVVIQVGFSDLLFCYQSGKNRARILRSDVSII